MKGWKEGRCDRRTVGRQGKKEEMKKKREGRKDRRTIGRKNGKKEERKEGKKEGRKEMKERMERNFLQFLDFLQGKHTGKHTNDKEK